MNEKIGRFENSALSISAKQFSWISIWTLFLCLSFVLFLTISVCVSYHPYVLQTGNVVEQEGNYVIQIYVALDRFDTIQHDIILLEGKEIPYQILEIKPETVLGQDQKEYREVKLSLALPPRYKIENQIVSFKIKQPKTTLFQFIIKKIQKGLQT